MILVGKNLNQNMICFELTYVIHGLRQEFLTKTAFKLQQSRQVTGYIKDKIILYLAYQTAV